MIIAVVEIAYFLVCFSDNFIAINGMAGFNFYDGVLDLDLMNIVIPLILYAYLFTFVPIIV